jgi:hypothetical protein
VTWRWKKWWPAVWLILGLTLLLGYTTLPLAISAPNERSRLYLTVALVERHSFAIDVEVRRFGRIFDLATHDGHLYSDKAPGSSLIAIPAYLALRAVFGQDQVRIEHLLLLGRFAVMLPLSLLGVLALRALLRYLDVSRSIAHLVALTSIVATAAFHYGAAFFGHHIVAVLGVLACLLTYRGRERHGATAMVHFAGVGAVLGLAQLTEYQAVVVTLPLFVHAVVSCRSRWLPLTAAMLLGGLPFALAFAFYHARCFGGPLELSYAHLYHRQMAGVHGQGIGGVLWPTAEGYFRALFSGHRGLLTTAPLLALAPVGPLGLWRRGHGAFAIASSLAVLFALSFMAGSLTWEAGWGYGPRLLLPVVPLLMTQLAVALEAYRRSWRFWALFASTWVASLVSIQAVTAFFPEPPNELTNPLLDVVGNLAGGAIVIPNLGRYLFDLEGLRSLVPLLLLLSWPGAVLLRTAVESSVRPRFLVGIPVALAIQWSVVYYVGPTQRPAERAAFLRYVSTFCASGPDVRTRSNP